MRFSSRLFAGANRKDARAPQLEPVPFKMLLPLELKTTVSEKGDKTKEAVCMQQLAVLFACFKKHDFDQAQCMKEVTAFQNCFNEYNERIKDVRESAKKGVLVPGETKMTKRQLNQLLRKFPPLPKK